MTVTAPTASVPLSGPSSPAIEPSIPGTGPAFSPPLYDQLVQRVAAEVTIQLQPSGHLIPLPLFLVWQRMTTEVPVVMSSAVDPVAQSIPIDNPSAVHQVAQLVRPVNSSLADEGQSTGTFQPKGIFTSANLPVDARVPCKLKIKI